jgi:hypothetical protein
MALPGGILSIASPGTPLIKNITNFSCAAADTAPGNAGTWGDGMGLMGELAIHSGAYVVAARDTQLYTWGGIIFKSPIDFGAWEEPVFVCDPANGASTPCYPGPMK